MGSGEFFRTYLLLQLCDPFQCGTNSILRRRSTSHSSGTNNPDHDKMQISADTRVQDASLTGQRVRLYGRTWWRRWLGLARAPPRRSPTC